MDFSFGFDPGSLISSGLGYFASKEAGNANADLQREFAQNALQWKVADAKKAGLHPLAALGTSPTAASPVYSGGHFDISAPMTGQFTDRARGAGETSSQRISHLKAQKAAADSATLQNELLRAQIRHVNTQSDDIIAQQAQASRAAIAQSSAPPAFPDYDDEYRYSFVYNPDTGDIDRVLTSSLTDPTTGGHYPPGYRIDDRPRWAGAHPTAGGGPLIMTTGEQVDRFSDDWLARVYGLREYIPEYFRQLDHSPRVNGYRDAYRDRMHTQARPGRYFW